MKKISVLVPCYNEQENVVPISEAIINELNKLNKYDYELIFIDNSSTDNTQNLITDMWSKNQKIKAIFNSRKFGQLN